MWGDKGGESGLGELKNIIPVSALKVKIYPQKFYN